MSGGTWIGIGSVALVIVLVLIVIEYIGDELRKEKNK